MPNGPSNGIGTWDFSMYLWTKSLRPFPNLQFNAYDLGEYLNFMTLFKAKQQAHYPSFTAPPANQQPKLLFFLFN